MNVLHVITGLHKGGAEGALVRLITHDGDDTHHVVSLIGGGLYAEYLTSRGTPVHSLDLPRGTLTLGAVARLRAIVREVSPDVVQTWMYHPDLIGGLVARTCGVPVVWGIRTANLDPGEVSRSTTLAIRLSARLSRWVPRAIISCSEAALKTHVARGYDAARMIVIPNGYDLDRLAPDAAARRRVRAEWHVPENCFLIGLVARWDPLKDHRTLIEALARFKSHRDGSWRCAFIGAGMSETNRELVTLIAANGLTNDILLLGPSDDIPGVMNALDLHVLSSIVEGFPNVVAEAMACGTPCVVTAVGDAGLIVGDTGWVVPVKDRGRMAGALEVAISSQGNSAAWTARRERCREHVAARFGVARMVTSYREVWDNATH